MNELNDPFGPCERLVQQIIERMRSQKNRHAEGYRGADVVDSMKVDEWADELAAALAEARRPAPPPLLTAVPKHIEVERIRKAFLGHVMQCDQCHGVVREAVRCPHCRHWHDPIGEECCWCQLKNERDDRCAPQPAAADAPGRAPQPDHERLMTFIDECFGAVAGDGAACSACASAVRGAVRAALEEAAPRVVDPPPLTWQPIEAELPTAGEPVLVVLQTPKPCVVVAQWCPKLTMPLHPDAEGWDYDEARDEYFALEGWYQCYAVNGSLDDEPFWLLHDPVTHWMPLPAPPEDR